jgi:hypothetical protein
MRRYKRANTPADCFTSNKKCGKFNRGSHRLFHATPQISGRGRVRRQKPGRRLGFVHICIVDAPRSQQVTISEKGVPRPSSKPSPTAL